MYIDFKYLNPHLLDTFKTHFDLQDVNLLYKITNTVEKKYDTFEKSISPYLFIDNTYYLSSNNSIFKLVSRVETSNKISNENLLTTIKLKITPEDIFKMYDNLNSLFTIFKDDNPQSQVKIISITDTPKEKTLSYVYINGSIIS